MEWSVQKDNPWDVSVDLLVLTVFVKRDRPVWPDLPPPLRDFLRQSATGLCVAGLAGTVNGAASEAKVPLRTLGKTGQKVSTLSAGLRKLSHLFGSVASEC